MKYLHNLSHRAFITLCIVVVFLVIVVFNLFALSYNNRIYPNIVVAGERVGGMSFEKAKMKLEAKERVFDKGLDVVYDTTKLTIGDSKTRSNPDASPLVVFDSEATLQQAIGIGRGENFFDNIQEQARSIFGGYSLDFSVSIDRLRLLEELRKNFSSYEKLATNAHVTVKTDSTIAIEDGEDGVSFNYEDTINTVINRFENGTNTEVRLAATTTHPEVKSARAEEVQGQVEKWLNLPTLTLHTAKEEWPVSRAIMREWLGLKKKDGAIVIGFDKARVFTYLEKEIVPKVAVESKPPRLEINNGKATIWQAGQDGMSLETDQTVDRIIAWSETVLANSEEARVELATKIIPNTEVNEGAEELGLKEIIGFGTSQFAGSPKNRRHNIRVGADALHGLLIKPGEEFSLLKALGEIDGAHGYLPELVIKENKTTPEYGGGLCQIGTTVFRATFNSGLPVTQRRNHSYRVVYYEPAGTDATIYDPAPDYRFLNDTGHHIAIQARMVGDELTFEFWGTKDGRTAEATKPVIYNIVQPAPTKIVETTDLPEGEKRCTEKAHAGADAYFDYKVTYATGEVKEKRFSSHYVPWQAVCLVGVKEKAPEGGQGTPTPTPTITPAATLDVQP